MKAACSGDGEWSLKGASACSGYDEGYEKDNTVRNAQPVKCPLGYYTLSQACTICPSGYYCDGTIKTICTTGKCPSGTATASSCPDWLNCVNFSN